MYLPQGGAGIECKRASNAWNVNNDGNANNNSVSNANGLRPDSIKLR